MTTLAQVKKIAEAMGATVEDQKIGNSHSCEILAPKGKMFGEGSTHILVDCAYTPWKPDYADLLSRLKYGMIDCNDPECEWCNPDEMV
jgi:hypothetical protein